MRPPKSGDPPEHQVHAVQDLTLVTGATGFIGRRLVDALRQRDVAVRALTRDAEKARTLWPGDTVTITHADFGETQTIGDACDDVQTVFHLAGHAHAEDEGVPAADTLHERITVAGTRALIDGAVRTGVRRVVFISSVKAMGEGRSECLDESSETGPTSAYGRAKREAERIVLEAGERHNFHACVLRLPLVYGPGVKGNLLRMMKAIEHGRFPPIPETGNSRSLVHVDDVVQAALLVADDPRANGQVYIVTDDRVYSTRQIYSLMRTALGKAVPHWSIPPAALQAGAKLGDFLGQLRGRRFVLDSVALDKLLGSAWYSCEKIKKLGYGPTHMLADSMDEMVAAYRAQPNRP
jgi:UDP-glucose 4-epimerase